MTAPPEVVEAIVAATLTAFEELAQTPLIPGEPYSTRTNPPADRVTAEITLRRAEPGRLLVVFPRPALEVLAARYLPLGTPLANEIVDDTAGEFANVIAGQTKTMLKGTLYHFTISTPRVGPLVNPIDAGREFLVLPFDFDAGRFAIYVLLPPCEE